MVFAIFIKTHSEKRRVGKHKLASVQKLALIV